MPPMSDSGFQSHHRLLSWMSAMWLKLDYPASLPVTIIDARSHTERSGRA